MSATATTYATVAIASDAAVAAAAEFDRFLASLTGSRIVEAPNHEIWQAIDSRGWLAAGETSGGEAPRLLDLIELAIVWGRHLIPGPFLTTLIARRHMAAAAAPAAFGYTYALGPGPGALVPFGGRADCVFLTRLGHGEAATTRVVAERVDTFAPSLPLATSATGSVVAPHIVHETIVLLAAEAIGMAEALLKRMIDYANIRTAFGQEIARFQAIRHRLADVHCRIEAMRGYVVAAVNEPDLASRAARLTVRAARGIAESCIQTHGAIGFTWDLGLHRYLRHAMATERLLARHAAK